MNRRYFIKNIAIGTSAVATGAIGYGVNTSELLKNKKRFGGFKLNYAPHDGMFRHHAGEDIIDQLNYMADHKFTAFEDNEISRRSIAEQETIARTMQSRNMTMGVFVAHKIYWQKPNLASGDKALREEFLLDIKKSIDIAKRINAKWMTVVPGHQDLSKDMSYQMVNVIESLKYAADILDKHELVMVLEPLNFFNHPGMFLSKSSQAYQICRAVDSPSCKILFDIYHQQIEEGNLLPNIKNYWNEISYFQIGDNPGRNEPTTGEINYHNIFKYIHNRGFEGVLGMEHGNSKKGKEGELAVIESYKTIDNY